MEALKIILISAFVGVLIIGGVIKLDQAKYNECVVTYEEACYSTEWLIYTPH